MTRLNFPYSLPLSIKVENKAEELQILFILHTYGFKWKDGSSSINFSAFLGDLNNIRYIYLTLHETFRIGCLTQDYVDSGISQPPLINKDLILQL